MIKFDLPGDRLGVSGTTGMFLMILALAALGLLLLDSGYRSAADHEECRQIIRALGLNSLSLVPSGHLLRNPGAIDLQIDLRFDPRLGRNNLDSADFLLKGLD